MKILVVRFSSIGDIVLCTPVVRWLKKTYPNAELHFLSKSNFSSILDDNPNIDKVWVLDDYKTTVKDLKLQHFDLLIDLHKNLRSFRFRLALNCKKVKTFNKLSFRKYLSVNFKTKRFLPNKHIVDRYYEGVKSLGLENDGLGLDFYGESKPSDFKELPLLYNVLVAGAAHKTKQLPESLIKKIADKSSLPLVVIGTKEDDRLLFSTEHFINLCGKSSLKESAYVIKYSQKVYTPDTGMMHIAAAFQKNIEVFWGNTIPEFGMYPYNVAHKNHEVKNLSCRPCSKIGFDECPKGHFKCMEEQVL